MLEHYFVKPSTIDRIRNGWLGAQIDSYVEWMEANGYARPTILRRVSQLCHFAVFAQKRGCTTIASAFDLIEEFTQRHPCAARSGSLHGALQHRRASAGSGRLKSRRC